MRLTVRLFAGLAERAGARTVVLDDLRDGLTLGELKRELERRRPELGNLAHVAGVVGTTYAHDGRVLAATDDVSLLPPVSGGEPDEDELLAAGVFVLERDSIDVAACLARVGHPSCGALASFIGVTRDVNRGQRVVRLEYEAFDAMTGPEMERIFARCRAAVATEPSRALRMLCVHRVGVVEIGEPSVAIAVASPHRDAAFAACRFLIDELKQTLPVWKKEHYADGHHWIGERS
ncbi:MAG: molybdenum cofactor biosynthesis protein MoaE [Planctomycetes bacterium]|nr:molybdenum cofactor biosynthesis protein MoaE [Planctomycetota bacterium]